MAVLTVPDPELWDGLIATAAEGTALEGPWIVAQYHGTCAACGERWEPGDAIRLDRDLDAWVCTGCGEEGIT